MHQDPLPKKLLLFFVYMTPVFFEMTLKMFGLGNSSKILFIRSNFLVILLKTCLLFCQSLY